MVNLQLYVDLEQELEKANASYMKEKSEAIDEAFHTMNHEAMSDKTLKIMNKLIELLNRSF